MAPNTTIDLKKPRSLLQKDQDIFSHSIEPRADRKGAYDENLNIRNRKRN